MSIPPVRKYSKNSCQKPTFTTVAAFKTWLNAQATNTANTAYNVALNVSNLGVGSTSVVGKALLDNPNKYVNLDLSGSTLNCIDA